MSRLATLLSIKPGEGRKSSLMIGIMLFSAMGAAFGGTGIEALFFARFGVDYLPYMYIGLGITSMFTSFLVTAALGRIPKRILYTAIPILIALLLVGARFALLAKLNWLYPVLWLGKEVLNSLINLVVWGVAGLVCDTRQAKRLFPLFNASRILGQVVGGLGTGLLVNSIGIENLLIVWAGNLTLSYLFSQALLARQQVEAAPQRKPKRKQPSLSQEMQRGYQYVRSSRLMTWISISTIFFSILFFSISLPFSRTATEHYLNEEALASFLGLFNGLSTAAAFITSLFLANRIFSRFGIMLSILALPVIYLVGFGALAITPLFIIIVAFRFMQMLWLSGIADPAWQTMFNVVPNEKRDQVRTFIGGVPEQAGTFIAGGLLVVGEQTLSPQQLYIIGFIAAAACTYIIFQARRGYNLALVDALRAGRPQLFISEEQPFGGFRQDAAAKQTALNGLHDPDPLVRRIAAEIVGNLSFPESTHALIHGLSDVDPLVRSAFLHALSNSKATSALLDIAASLSDPEPDVRSQAVTSLAALSPDSPALTKLLIPLLDDPNAKVSTRAALALLRRENANEKAKYHLRQTAILGDLEDRTYALQALGEWGDREAFDFLVNELDDHQLEPSIKNVILTSLAKIDLQASIPYLTAALKDVFTRAAAARLLGGLGSSITDSMISLLNDDAFTDGVLLTLEHLPPPPSKPMLDFARLAVSRAGEYDALRRRTQASAGNDRAQSRQGEALLLLEESLHEKSHQYGIHALRAVGLLGDRDSMNLAIENLESHEAGQRANVIEALDSISAKYRDIIQPLTKLWEDESLGTTSVDWERLSNDPDEWIRECAAFAKRIAQNNGETNMDTPTTLSLMDRILFFKRVPLFTTLSPVDLKQVASIADEEFFNEGEEIAHEGEMGDVMFIIVSGEVKVCSDRNGNEVEIARRTAGDYVGEMSIIGREPRMASLVAVGDVRTLCIDQRSFEGLIRERPDVSLGVMKELSRRLKEASLKK